PLALGYLMNMGMAVSTPLITIKDYISLLVIMIFSFGAVFETPLIIVLLVLLDLVTIANLKEWRRYAVVGICLLAAALTPPDPISMLSLAIPVYLMYEATIVFLTFITKGKSPKIKSN